MILVGYESRYFRNDGRHAESASCPLPALCRYAAGKHYVWRLIPIHEDVQRWLIWFVRTVFERQPADARLFRAGTA